MSEPGPTAGSDPRRHQRLRLMRTLFACVGGLALNVTAWALMEHGQMRLDPESFARLSIGFWLVNCVFVAMIATDLNLRFSDPSLTLPQILWGTATLFVVAYYLEAFRYISLFFFMLIMLFGVFRLRFGGFLVVSVFAAVGYGAMIATLQVHHPTSVDVGAELISWGAFCVVLVMFSIVGNDLSRIRQALSQRNRELRASRDAANAANEAKSELLATVSHEIRTPLNSILGMIELLGETSLSDEQRRYMSTTHRSSVHLLSLVERMLSIASIENDNTVVRDRPLALDEILPEACEIVAAGAREKGLALEWRRDPTLPDWILGDGDRIREVLLNLVGNAVKYTEHGSIEVVAERHEAPSGKLDLIEFRVMDTGRGIEPEALEHVFEPFYQADSSITRDIGGAGLGLAVCKRQIDKMEGTIGVRSEPQRGSVFWIRLPLRPAKAPHPVALPPRPDDVRVDDPGATRRILLADDSMDNRLLILAFLKQQPYDVVEAEDGREAVSRFETEHFDLVLMDIHMPVMDGLEATRRIRAFESAHSHERTPIVALTADTLTQDARGTGEAGCDAHLTKPVSKTTLLATLERFARLRAPVGVAAAR